MFICLQTTTKDNTAAFVKTLKNNLKRRVSGRSKPKYLPVEADNQLTRYYYMVKVLIIQTSKKNKHLKIILLNLNQREITTFAKGGNLKGGIKNLFMKTYAHQGLQNRRATWGLCGTATDSLQHGLSVTILVSYIQHTCSLDMNEIILMSERTW